MNRCLYTVPKFETGVAGCNHHLPQGANATIIDHQVMTHPDLKAVNTAKKQEEVAPKKGTSAKVDGDTLSVVLPPYSYHLVRVKI